MILGLIFSKDRALQLDACLRSFARHVEDAAAVSMHVIYRASSESLERQYRELARWYAGQFRFTPEGIFRSQVLEIFGEAEAPTAKQPLPFDLSDLWQRARSGPRPKEQEEDLVLFLVDDTLFVRPMNLALAQTALQANKDALGFSLRLGRNTVRNYILGRSQPLPKFQAVNPGMLKFEWTKAVGDFSYPLEISSSLYRLSQVARLVSSLSFTDPNTLESGMSLRAKRFARRTPTMLCSEHSVAFSTPLNRVQNVYQNRAGERPEWSTERLAEKFDEGLRINIAALDGFMPSACHQELELSFEPRTAPPAA